MKTSARAAFLESHIPAVAIATLLLWSLGSAVQVLDVLWFPLTDYLATAISTLAFPSSEYFFSDRLSALIPLLYAFEAIAELGAAWLLSKWAFGSGPIRALIAYRVSPPRRRAHA